MKRFLSIVTNKFLITAVAFAVWMVFLDENNWASQEERKQELKETDRNIAYLNSEIETMEKDYHALTTDPKRIEQYARERYRMKKDNEDLYIVEH